ncbi:SDR family oxidoreductase [Patescibacteria group bacterium]|nr:SDR family oxidoreductase [Patescibacteria group bacterium]MBU4512519.1 SDR family oxidoreductase [Patescibacteria group bacterium]MCG2693502.1 SDR family oxidoreductase [Candidatus Parcubacteria bacterium]
MTNTRKTPAPTPRKVRSGAGQAILVTGGAGFIGSHLCERLLGEGNEVLCLDNFYTGSKENIKHLIDNKNFELIRHNINLPIFLEVDQIYNLACPAAPPHYQNDPIETTKTCVIGMINMLGLAKRTGARILQASTSEIYGDPLENPQKETYRGNVNTLGPRACYDEGKRCSETLCMDYYRQHQVDIRIIRIFNTFGPRMALNDGRVVSNFIISALKNEPITIYGDGSQTRSFQYVDDLVSGMIKMMEQDDFVGPVNLGNPDERSIRELAGKIIGLTDSRSQVIYKPLPEDDPKVRKPDITLAKERLNWEPKVGLEEGLNKTIDYFKNIMQI